MRRALELAALGVGRTGDNPSVGCVIVKDGAVVGEGATAEGGRPHAEEIALAQAGVAARGATAFVTVETCAKRSTGAISCADRLIEAGVARVVIAARDPHPYAAGVGIERLRAAGVAVEVGLMGADARAQNADFFAKWERAAEITLTPADEDQYSFAIELYLLTMRPYSEALIPWDEDKQRESFNAQWKVSDVEVLHHFGERVGWLQIEEAPSQLWLQHFYIVPERQKRGIGGVVLEQVIARARGRAIVLGVLKNNPARRLYERHGFRVDQEEGMKLVMSRH